MQGINVKDRCSSLLLNNLLHRSVCMFALTILLATVACTAYAATPVTLKWSQPTANATLSGTVQFQLTGQAFKNVEIFQSGKMIARAVVSADMTSATAAIDTKQFTAGAVTLTAHAWNSAPGTAFTSDADAGALSFNVGNVTLKWLQPAANSTVNGTMQIRLVGQAFKNVEIFSGGKMLVRASVSTDMTSATASIDTKQFANGALALTAHAWNSAPGTAFTSDADAGTLNLAVNNAQTPTANSAWSPLSHLATVHPTDFGAVADDSVDDSNALTAAVDALPTAGGIVVFPAGTFEKKQRLWTITKSHVFLWAPNGRATLHATVAAPTGSQCPRQQAVIFQRTSGGGVFGLRMTSNATQRSTCAEDNALVFDGVNGAEATGTEITGSNAVGIFAWNSNSTYPAAQHLFINGNYVHHTYADSIHQTSGTRDTRVWGNWIFNEAPTNGDDGIACVTYGVSGPQCGQMEWWNNNYVGGVWGRGLAVIGGDHILIHHNWIVRSEAAGIIVASESSYNSASSSQIDIQSNWIVQSPNGSVANGHSSILVSGGNSAAAPINNVRATGNVIVDAPFGAERAEGSYDAATVTFNDSTDRTLLPGPTPTSADAHPTDTTIFRTQDTSFVTADVRRGLFRIHVRESGAGLQERFEYVVRGASASVSSWLASIGTMGAYTSESRTVAGTTYALVLAPKPLAIPAELSAVSFDDLRVGDRNGTLSWLWSRIDQANY